MTQPSRSAFSSLPGAARYLWAKSAVDHGNGHGILAHLLDVAAVTEVLLAAEPESTLVWASAQFGLPAESCERWLAALAGLHDFGKAIPGFQAKWPEGMQADLAQGLSFPIHACGVTRHSCATAALLGEPLQAVSKAGFHWLRHVIQAISAHHGYHFLDEEVNRSWPSGEPPEWQQARRAILDAYWRLLDPQGAPTSKTLGLPAVNWLAGLTSTADWIASNPEWFPLGERYDDLQCYYDDALRLAKEALQQIGWGRYRPLLTSSADSGALLARIVGREGLQARPLQQAGDRLLRSAQGPALMLVEAPMGEGKTELAFLAHLRLQATNGHRGLYLALPTQATGNALFKRALIFLENFVTDPADVQLVHGGASMNEDAQRLHTVHLRGIDQNTGETLSASAWFSQRRRPLLSPYGVGTVDQALYAALNVKHHFVRLWGLGNRVVVLDEVHAYDTYTSGLIVVLLRWLKALGSSVVLMSATLPRSRRNELIEAWGLDAEQVPELAYPRVLLADAMGVRGENFSARPLSPIRLGGLGESIDELAEKALALLAGGGCGAVIVNTVDRAQKLYLLLRERLDDGVPLLLFHARFPLDERGLREQQVLSLFGPQGKRPARALLIATQVAEQSLDLDFDFMLSDLAPVDLLLQRAGRLHRHVRPRPQAHVDASLWVAGLLPAFPELKETAWGFVYDPYILGRTWALLRQEPVLQLPEDIDRLVQEVYGDGPLPEGLDEQVLDLIEIASYGEYRAKVNKERQESRNAAIDPSAELSEYANKPQGHDEDDLLGVRNTTRLGRESVTLVPVDVADDGWRIGDTHFSPDHPLDDTTAARLYARQVRLSHTAVVKHFQTCEVPVAFAEHALLRNFYPLPLRAGRYEQDRLCLRLDEEVGLVYDMAKRSSTKDV